jgi:hypothetical protein
MAKFCENCGHPLDDGARFCDMCGRSVRSDDAPKEEKPVARLCSGCGAEVPAGDVFCQKCGTRYEAPAQAPKVQQPAYQPPAAAFAPPPRKARTNAGMIVGIVLGSVALVAIIAVGIFWWLGKNGTPASTAEVTKSPAPVAAVELIPFPDELKIDAGKVDVKCPYTYPDTIIPANYRSLDSIVFMQCSTDRGSAKLLVSVEIPEFTQKYEQMVEVTRAETELKIHPPMLEGAAAALNTSKDAQLIVTVKNLDNDQIIVQDTKPIKLYSRYDMQWQAKDGTPYYENILAWVTPSAPEIDQMLRLSADNLNELTEGGMNAIVGYQEVEGWTHAQVTYAQVCAMMDTLAYTYGVKYVMAPFSPTSSDLQSIKTPSQVLNNAAGLCVETAVTMASAIERTNMHALIILLPGHAQVAVETWYGSGEYLLIETTALDDAAKWNFYGVVVFELDADQWTQYLAQEGYVAIDCDLAEKLHIQSID